MRPGKNYLRPPKKRPKKTVFEMFEEKKYIDYAKYAKFRKKLKTL